MKTLEDVVNSVVQPSLFPLPAVAVSLHALCDSVGETVVFVVESRDPVEGSLCALWSSSPLPTDRYLKGLHEAHKEFLRQVWDVTGPFA